LSALQQQIFEAASVAAANEKEDKLRRRKDPSVERTGYVSAQSGRVFNLVALKY